MVRDVLNWTEVTGEDHILGRDLVLCNGGR